MPTRRVARRLARRPARTAAPARARIPWPEPVRLLVLLLIGGIGAGISAYGLHRGGRAARIGALVGVVALVGVTVAAFLLRPGRLDDSGEPLRGIFDAHLVATAYLRLIVGLWGL